MMKGKKQDPSRHSITTGDDTMLYVTVNRGREDLSPNMQSVELPGAQIGSMCLAYRLRTLVHQLPRASVSGVKWDSKMTQLQSLVLSHHL